MLRLATAAVLMPLVWVVIKKAPSWTFLGLAIVMISVATWEVYRMLEVRGLRPFKWVGLLSCWGILFSFLDLELEVLGFGLSIGATTPLVAGTLTSVAVAMAFRPTPEKMLQDAMATLFPLLVVGLCLGYLVGLRGMPGNDGQDLLILLFLCVIAADSFAFYFGSLFGRHKMAPVLSPKKSWEGAAAGLAGSVIAALLGHFWFYQRLSLQHAIVLGLTLGLAGMIGDLSASMLKRATGVKNSSELLPGHGGMFDRTDSLIFTAPFLYYYYLVFLMGKS
jgi:phosphatidate cytidylyltransferase